jgi:hypothetical protein
MYIYISLYVCMYVCIHQAVPNVSAAATQQLSDMGFLRDAIMQAMNATGHTSVTDLNTTEGAEVLTWLIEHNQNVISNAGQGMDACMFSL